MENILSLAKKKAQQAEVFLVTVESTPVIFEANRLKQLDTRQSRSISLRIVNNGRTGFSTTTRLKDNASLVDRAVAVSQFGAPARFILPSLETYPEVRVYDAEVAAFAVEKMIGIGESLISKVRAHTPDILCEAMISKSVVSVEIINSQGGRAKFSRSSFGISLEGTLIHGTDMLFVGDRESSCSPIQDTGKLADSVIRQLELSKRQASISGGIMPVIFTPNGVVSAFIAPLATAFSGRVVLQNASPLVDKLGVMMFDENLSLKDDATLNYRPVSRPCDDEGVPSRSTSLIEKGVVKEFFYDLQTAGLAGVKSTGNGERSGGGLPGPSISNLVFGTGKTSFEDMVADMKEGLVVEQLMGAEQTNVLGGDFSGNVLLGYKVEKGKIAGRVKDTVVSGNVYKVLKNLAGIGSEAKWASGGVLTPAFYCSNLTVGSKG